MKVFSLESLTHLFQGFDEDSDEVEYVLSIMDQLTQELIEEGRLAYYYIMMFKATRNV